MEGHDHEEIHLDGHGHGSMQHVDVESIILTNPQNIMAGEKTKITFELKKDNNPLINLEEHHSRKIHVVIISKDMNIFGHIHPEDFNYENSNGLYSVDFNFPRSGKYLIAIDGMTKEGKFSKQFIVNVKGNPEQGEIYVNYEKKNKVFGNVEIRENVFINPINFAETKNGEFEIIMNSSDQIKKGEETTMGFTVMKNGNPLNDLSIYLDAPMHFAIVKNDFTDFMHEHGTLPGGGHDKLPDNFGPTIELRMIFKDSGTYQLIGQIKHGNKVIVVPFTVDIGE